MTPWKIASTPEEAGLSSKAMMDYLDALKDSGMEHHSIMVFKNGFLAASMHFAPHTAKTPHICYSISKPFTSLAAGFAVEEGLLSYDDRILDVLSESAPENPDAWLQEVTLHHLLCMGSGLRKAADNMSHIFEDGAPVEDWAKATLAYGCDAAPGTRFSYNSHGSYLISCMVQKAVGMNIRDYLMPRLFEPLGIEKPHWDTSPQGVCCGGWGLYLPCEDMLKFGVCLAGGGMWEGRQVIPKAWLDIATQSHIDTANRDPRPTLQWAQGYGYHLWRCTDGRFRGDGSNGQFIIVDPARHMAVAVTGDHLLLPRAHELIDDFLFNEAIQTPSDEATQTAYFERVKTLSL